jgi:hypothetical protein
MPLPLKKLALILKSIVVLRVSSDALLKQLKLSRNASDTTGGVGNTTAVGLTMG